MLCHVWHRNAHFIKCVAVLLNLFHLPVRAVLCEHPRWKAPAPPVLCEHPGWKAPAPPVH